MKGKCCAYSGISFSPAAKVPFVDSLYQQAQKYNWTVLNKNNHFGTNDIVTSCIPDYSLWSSIALKLLSNPCYYRQIVKCWFQSILYFLVGNLPWLIQTYLKKKKNRRCGINQWLPFHNTVALFAFRLTVQWGPDRGHQKTIFSKRRY